MDQVQLCAHGFQETPFGNYGSALKGSGREVYSVFSDAPYFRPPTHPRPVVPYMFIPCACLCRGAEGSIGWQPVPLQILAAAYGDRKDSGLAMDITVALNRLVAQQSEARNTLSLPGGSNLFQALALSANQDPCPGRPKVALDENPHFLSLSHSWPLRSMCGRSVGYDTSSFHRTTNTQE